LAEQEFPKQLDLPLSFFNQKQDVQLQGITSEWEFFFPAFSFALEGEIQATLFFTVSSLAGPRSMISVYANGQAVKTSLLRDLEGVFRFSVPREWAEESPFLSLSFLVTLDYGSCDFFALDTRSLWFRISNASFFRFQGEFQTPVLFADFFRFLPPDGNFWLSLPERDFDAMRTALMAAQALGLSSKGISAHISLEASPEQTTPWVEISAEPGISSDKGTLSLPVSAASFLSLPDFRSIPFSRFSFQAPAPVDPISPVFFLEDLGLDLSPRSFAYQAQYPLFFPLDLFAGRPQKVQFYLPFVASTSRGSALLVKVFVNDQLVFLRELATSPASGTLDFSVDGSLFSPQNRLLLDISQVRSNCEPSEFQFLQGASMRPLGTTQAGGFPVGQWNASMLGNTLFVASSVAQPWASLMVQAAFEKGKAGLSPRRIDLVDLAQFLQHPEWKEDFDSFVFFLPAGETERVYPGLSLDTGIRVNRSRTGELFFSVQPEEQAWIVSSFSQSGKPAMLFSHYPSFSPGSAFSPLSWEGLESVRGNLGILSAGEWFSFQVGEGLEIAEETVVPQTRFWMQWRFWLSLGGILLVMLFLTWVFNKTSRKAPGEK